VIELIVRSSTSASALCTDPIGQRKNVFSGVMHSRRQTSFIMQLRQRGWLLIALLHVACLLSKMRVFLPYHIDIPIHCRDLEIQW
jgi:hypothetical protein